MPDVFAQLGMEVVRYPAHQPQTRSITHGILVRRGELPRGEKAGHSSVPYAAPTPNELLTKHLRAPVPSVAGVNSNITPDCADLISSMMAKKRERRPGTMNECVKALQRLRVFRTRPKPPSADGHAANGDA